MHPTATVSEGVVLADVGGTNVRFAVLTGGVLGPIEHMAVRDHQRFTDALAIFMARQTERAAIRSAIFAVAGVVKGSAAPSRIIRGSSMRPSFARASDSPASHYQ